MQAFFGCSTNIYTKSTSLSFVVFLLLVWSLQSAAMLLRSLQTRNRKKVNSWRNYLIFLSHTPVLFMTDSYILLGTKRQHSQSCFRDFQRTKNQKSSEKLLIFIIYLFIYFCVFCFINSATSIRALDATFLCSLYESISAFKTRLLKTCFLPSKTDQLPYAAQLNYCSIHILRIPIQLISINHCSIHIIRIPTQLNSVNHCSIQIRITIHCTWLFLLSVIH